MHPLELAMINLEAYLNPPVIQSKVHLSYQSSATLINISALEVFSTKDLLLINCPQLGKVTALGDVILINCPIHGMVIANGTIHIYESGKNHLYGKNVKFYSTRAPFIAFLNNVKCDEDLITSSPELHLLNSKIKGTVCFHKDGDPEFQGVVTLEGSSSIGFPDKVNGTIKYSKKEKVQPIKEIKKSPKNKHLLRNILVISTLFLGIHKIMKFLCLKNYFWRIISINR